jgi:hypothetical protein
MSASVSTHYVRTFRENSSPREALAFSSSSINFADQIADGGASQDAALDAFHSLADRHTCGAPQHS